jgi:hypothetical protein
MPNPDGLLPQVGGPSTAGRARVYLLPPDQVVDPVPPLSAACYEEIRGLFPIQAATAHTLVPDPDAADLVLAPIQFTGYGPCFERLRRSPAYRRHAHKLVVYCPDDNQFPALRGLYPAAPRRWVARGWAMPAHYVSAHIQKFRFVADELRSKDVLFSFVGSRTHPVRERILRLQHPGVVVIDSTPTGKARYWWEGPNKDRFFATFRDVTRRSQFVICPRGISPSSIRLFEAMEAATVPVIVADDLELPRGPTWELFSVRVREREVDTIPALIDRIKDRAAEMGWAARRAWKAYFSERATVGTLVLWARLLLPRPHRRPVALRVAEYLSPRRIRAKLRHGVG